MDIIVGLMLTAVALSEGAETPLGHAEVFGPADEVMRQDGASEGLQGEAAGSRRDMVNTIAEAVQLLEYSEQFVEDPSRDEVYDSLRRLADEQETE